MVSNLEKAQIMFKLARKNNWGNKYDRAEHFKRFPNLDQVIKELSNSGWLILHKKSKFLGISLNSSYKKEIIEFIETLMPYIKGVIK
tara:strand:+ start:551 stop:811 length:261 start_codon:yes stop_codon:yes gene_type:complete